MHTKQTVIVIGATGSIGSSVAKNLVKGNYRLLLNDKNLNGLYELKDGINRENPLADVDVIDCSFDGCWEADIIITTIPFTEEIEVADKIREVANQKIVISFSNALNKGCDELQMRLTNSKVVCVVNKNVDAGISNFARNVAITGNDEEALQIAAELLGTAGFYISIQKK